MRRRTLTLVLFAAALVAGGGIWYASVANKPTTQYVTAVVTRGDVQEVVSESGTVTVDERDLFFEQTGTVKTVSVQIGDHVEAGQELMTLSDETLVAQLHAAEATRDAAQGKLAQLYAGSTSQDIAIAQTAVVNAQIALDKANQNLIDVRASSGATDLLKQIALTSAQSALTNAQQSAASALASAMASANGAGEEALTDVSVALDNADLTLGIDNEPANDAYEQDLAIMNSGALLDAQNHYATAKDALASAQSALALALDDAAMTAALAETMTAIDDAVLVLDDLTDVLNATVATANISQEEINTKLTLTNTDRAKLAADNTSVSAASQTLASTLVTNQTSIDNAENALATAEQDLAATQTGETADVNAAESAVNVAAGELQAAKDELAKVQAGPRSVDASALAAEVRQAQAQVDQLNIEIGKTVLTAPVAGVISDVAIDVGEIAGVSTQAITLVADAAYDVEANVSELDIAHVTAGDKADLTVEALGSVHVAGTVRRVDPTEKIVDGDVFYRVIIDMDEPLTGLRSGMSVDVTLTTEIHTGVLTVPTRAVFRSGGQNVVRVIANNVVSERTVQIGLHGANAIEILSGLSEGETVIVSEKN